MTNYQLENRISINFINALQTHYSMEHEYTVVAVLK